MSDPSVSRLAGPFAVAAGVLVVGAQLVMLPFDPQDHVATTTAVAFQIGGVAYLLGFVMLMLLVVASHEWLAVEAGRLGVTATIGAAVGTMALGGDLSARDVRGPLAGRRGAERLRHGPDRHARAGERCRAYLLFAVGSVLYGAAVLRARAPVWIGVGIVVGGAAGYQALAVAVGHPTRAGRRRAGRLVDPDEGGIGGAEASPTHPDGARRSLARNRPAAPSEEGVVALLCVLSLRPGLRVGAARAPRPAPSAPSLGRRRRGGPTSAGSVTVSSVWVTSPGSGSALVSTGSTTAVSTGSAFGSTAPSSAGLSRTAVAVPAALAGRRRPSPDGAGDDAAGAGVGAGARLTDASSSWATSRTSTSSRADPSACLEVRPSDSITRQNGQPVAIWSAPVSTASVVRLRLIRSPMFSSIHIRAPPAPQQKERSLLRGISFSSALGMTSSSSRGGE